MFENKSKNGEQGSGDAGIFEEIIDNLPVALFAKDASDDFRFILWNKKQEDITTIKRSRALGRNDKKLFSKESAKYFREMDESVIRKGTAVTIPQEIIETDEGVIYLRTIKLPIVQNDRTIIVGISEDITDRVHGREKLERLNKNLTEKNRELEDTQLQLIQAEKLESIGRLAAGVAHEVKNPLALLVMGVEYLNSGIDGNDPNVPEILSEMNDAIDRADKIVRGLVDLSSNRRMEREVIDPVEACEHVLLIMRHEVNRHSIAVKRDFQMTNAKIVVDRGKFEQVLLNVFTNAIHAMTGCPNPELCVNIRQLTLSDVQRNEGARDAAHLRKGDSVVVIEIQDNGEGIAAENINKVFDPFFTTKATGAGTGLGLSVVRKIIELHKGSFSLENRTPQKGATATITIPAQPSEEAKID